MTRDTTHKIKTIDALNGRNWRTTNISDGRQGVIGWITNSKVIYIACIENANKTTVPLSTSLETVDPDNMGIHLQSMLDNGWTIKEGLDITPEDFG